MEMCGRQGMGRPDARLRGRDGIVGHSRGGGNPGEPPRIGAPPQARYDCNRCSTQAYRCRSAWRFASIHASCLSAGR